MPLGASAVNPDVSDINHTQYDSQISLGECQDTSPDEQEKSIEVDVQDLQCYSDQISPDHFRLLRVLGEGSFGKVYLVRKTRGTHEAGRLFAMKVLRKACLKMKDSLRTRAERNILAKIVHPFIVRLEYAFQTEGKLYLILEYLRGGDLFTRLSKELMFTENDVKFYLAELALALDHLHGLGIIYRDLKPENVLLDVEGHVKLTDFGLSKEAIDGHTFSFCGTIEYMAPEVVRRCGHDAVADWWSYGVLMFEMLTGSLPFSSDDRRETMKQIIKAKLRMPEFISRDGQELLRALFKRNPSHRLGYGPDAMTALKQQPFFANIDWDRLLAKEVPPPFKPVCSPSDDAYYYDYEFNLDYPKDSPGLAPSAEHDGLFEGFNYVASKNRALPANSALSTQSACAQPTLEQTRSSGLNCLTLKGAKLVEQFHADYEVKEIIKVTPAAVVNKCLHRHSGRFFSVKIVNKSQRDTSEEVAILMRFRDLQNVIQLIDLFESNTHVYMVMEHLAGCELLDRILRRDFFSEREASEVIETLVRVIAHLHHNGVEHRDLRPSNIVYVSADHDPASLRICNFDFARQLRAENGLFMTSHYLANCTSPEVMRSQAQALARDTWSVGVLLSIMLSGRAPSSRDGLHSPTEFSEPPAGDGSLEARRARSAWEVVSPAARDLVTKLLDRHPVRRLTAEQILQHPWIRDRYKLPDRPLHLDSFPCRTRLGEVETTLSSLSLRDQNQAPSLGPVSESKLAARRRSSGSRPSSTQSLLPSPEASTVRQWPTLAVGSKPFVLG